MGKKQYITPKIIDLSIETITGIGAGNCDTGRDFHTSSCNPEGQGATNECNHGDAVSASCSTGNLPHQSGEMCMGGQFAGKFCEVGGSASGAFGRCTHGGAATGVCVNGFSPTPSFCDTGSGKGLCSNGNDQVFLGSS